MRNAQFMIVAVDADIQCTLYISWTFECNHPLGLCT